MDKNRESRLVSSVIADTGVVPEQDEAVQVVANALNLALELEEAVAFFREGSRKAMER